MPPSTRRYNRYNKQNLPRKMDLHLKICFKNIFNFAEILNSIEYINNNPADAIKKQIIKTFVRECVDTIKNQYNRSFDNSLIQVADVMTVQEEVIRPSIDQIGEYIAKWRLQGSIIDDVYKILNQLIIDLNITTDDTESSILGPSGSPCSVSNSMSDVIVNSCNNSPSGCSAEIVMQFEITNKCLEHIEDVKKNKFNYVIMVVLSNKLEVDMAGSGGLDNFLENIRKGDCRFGLYLHDYKSTLERTKHSKMQAKLLMLWCPDEAEDQMKSQYYVGIDLLKNIIGPTQFLQATTASEASIEFVQNLLEKN